MTEYDLSRRRFLQLSIGAPAAVSLVSGGSFLEGVVSEPDNKKLDKMWRAAREHNLVRQPSLDMTLNSDPEAKKLIYNFYAVYIEEGPPGKDPWELSSGGKHLKFYGARSDEHFAAELRRIAKKHITDSVRGPDHLSHKKTKYGRLGLTKAAPVEQTRLGAYKHFVAEVIDQVSNKNSSPLLDVREENSGADIYLPRHLWGRDVKPVGLVTKEFFEDKSYKTAEDRKSYLLDYLLFAKGGDFAANPAMKDLWDKGTYKHGVNTVWLDGIKPVFRQVWTAILKNRWANMQGQKVLDKKRKISSTYERALADRRQNSPEFRQFLRLYTDVAKKEIRRIPGYRKRKILLEDFMGVDWRLTNLPFNGKIVKYDSEKVKQYEFKR